MTPVERNLRRHRIVVALAWSEALRDSDLTASEIRRLAMHIDRGLDDSRLDSQVPPLEAWPDQCRPTR